MRRGYAYALSRIEYIEVKVLHLLRRVLRKWEILIDAASIVTAALLALQISAGGQDG